MTDDRTHVLDELGAYALDALDRGDHVRVRAHLASCATCARQLADYRQVANALPFALPPASPPAEAWTAIRSSIRRRPAAWRRVAPWSAVVAVAAALLLWNVSLQRELARYADGPQVEKLARRPARLVILKGVAKPEASARLFAAFDGKSGHMAISGLAPLSGERVYQLWFVPKTGAAASAATFNVDGEGRAWVVVKVPGPLNDMQALVVTLEPSSGRTTPTGPVQVEAREWR